ncbi:MAG: tRNA 5-methoxyuridine(34)/uridine 5-oxyacetic acid(34) synthase CmoB [Campylobacteraceae bacterium]|jgi:tRNA (mo5U34)-methyltransferase|nr:tRNA 5-methoxyuridine(34)/uridine 5-oxyacetic acid(34) synthase CmoB [Campylobacteraceae bacterium]
MSEKSQKQKEIVLSWKNIKPLREAIDRLPNFETSIAFGDIFKINIKNFDEKYEQQIRNTALLLRSWRKGPFQIENLFIDAEWKSFIKYNLLRSHFDLNNKKVADIGCNNGYYLFKMLEDNPKKLIGFDPTPLFWCQFDFINHFAKTDILYELLGVEDLSSYEEKFDVIFCLGVLYHRSDPLGCLKSLFSGLEKDGELFLDTFMIEGNEDMALCPKNSYSKISNVYFIPTINALRNWCEKAGFSKFEVLAKNPTDITEQRKTEWVLGQSLEDFLDPNDNTKTIEGYPSPKRVYVKVKKTIVYM